MSLHTFSEIELDSKLAHHKEPSESVSRLYGSYNKPELQKALKLLKLDISYTRASGDYLYYLKNGNEIRILDFLGGYGSTILGHNHSSIKSRIFQFFERDEVVHAQASVRSHAAFLAQELNRFLPSKYVATLVNTGTEAIEAAIKHALMEWQEKRRKVLIQLNRFKNQMARTQSEISGLRYQGREIGLDEIQNVIVNVTKAEPVFIALEGSFHGKTAGSLSLTFNASYRDMYPYSAVQSRFLRRDASVEEIDQLFQGCHLISMDRIQFSSILGVCIELIQGEGGIRCLSEKFVSHLSKDCRHAGIPLITDEIQTGLFRTGKFLASEWYGVWGDYIALGKSLGGGVAKIATLLVREDRYQKQFGMLHTSTFAEDDFSSCIAVKTLDLLKRDSGISDRALWFEKHVSQSLERISAECPGVIREVRGRGWMMGVEVIVGEDESAPLFLKTFQDSGLLTWICASYLFHRHRVRVAVTLNDSKTIRLEPSAAISESDTFQLLNGLESLARKIYFRDWAGITGHLWRTKEEFIDSPLPPVSRVPKVKRESRINRVVFLSHIIDLSTFRKFDPFLESLHTTDARKLMGQMDRWANGVIYHQQEIRGANGKAIFFELRGICAPTLFFETSFRKGDFEAYEKVRASTQLIEELGTSYLGLGQYTSVVSDCGTLLTDHLNSGRMKITTGNSLTVGMAYRGLQTILSKRNQKLSELKVGVIGVVGNICNVYAQILADEADSLVLIHREPLQESARFRRTVKSILDHSKIDESKLKASNDLSTLIECDLIVIGTNSTKQFLMPIHLKKGAIVMDISVPSNIHPTVVEERPDVLCLQGGYVKLPLDQRLESDFLPCPDGQVFACMAETMMTGLSSYPGNFSLGEISKDQVFHSLKLAESLGFQVGSLRRKGF